jgi:hypothetical protein
MKKHNLKKFPIKGKRLAKVTKSNIKDYVGNYRSILPVAIFALFLTVFVSINVRLIPKLEDLPQTGDTSELAIEAFATNAHSFISSPEGIVFLIFFFVSLMTFLAFIAGSGFPRRK